MARAMPKERDATETLQSRLDGGERFGQTALLDLLRAIAEPLEAAHGQGRFHGSLTPADIRFDEAGEVAIDGWERDTTPDAMRASRYAAIECYAPVHPQGPWTDVYALGAIAWRAITGSAPAEVLHRKGDVTLAKLAPSGFEPTFLAGIDAALEIAPQRRPQSVGGWLARFDRGPPAAPAIPAVVPSADPVAVVATDRAAPFRRWAWPATAIAAGLAAVAGAIWRPPVTETTPSRTPSETATPEPIIDRAPTAAPEKGQVTPPAPLPAPEAPPVAAATATAPLPQPEPQPVAPPREPAVAVPQPEPGCARAGDRARAGAAGHQPGRGAARAARPRR
jgi:non-specific serine/threonine protein kinase